MKIKNIVALDMERKKTINLNRVLDLKGYQFIDTDNIRIETELCDFIIHESQLNKLWNALLNALEKKAFRDYMSEETDDKCSFSINGEKYPMTESRIRIMLDAIERSLENVG